MGRLFFPLGGLPTTKPQRRCGPFFLRTTPGILHIFFPTRAWRCDGRSASSREAGAKGSQTVREQACNRSIDERHARCMGMYVCMSAREARRHQSSRAAAVRGGTAHSHCHLPYSAKRGERTACSHLDCYRLTTKQSYLVE